MTTARDMGLLAAPCCGIFPTTRPYSPSWSWRSASSRLPSYNDLLRTLEGADGMKTGFTCAAGYNIVASATRGRRKIIAVVLGEASGMDRPYARRN